MAHYHRPMSLDWTGCRNARELGGLPTVDGGHIRAGALWRTGSHHRLAAETVQAVGATVSPMLNTLAHLDARYGGAQAYLLLTGTDHQLQQEVRHRLR